MKKYHEIKEFFDSYIEFIGEILPNLPPGHVMEDSEADKFVTNEFGITKPMALNDEILKLVEKHGLPEYYKEFLSAYSYRNLELPLVVFPSTHPNDGLRELKSDIEKYVGYGLIPFASNKSGLGVYCIDLQQEEAIVFYENNELPNSSVRKKKLVSSFLSLLLFLKEYLDWGGNISGLDEEDKPEALAELKRVDPVMATVWQEWWLPRLLVNGE